MKNGARSILFLTLPVVDDVPITLPAYTHSSKCFNIHIPTIMPIRPSLQFITSLTLTFVSSLFSLAGAAEWQEISSPNGAYEVGFSLGEKGRPLYRVSLNNTEIIAPSGLGFILARDVDWTTRFGNPVVSNRSRQNKSWKPVWGERAIVQDNFISATVTDSTTVLKAAMSGQGGVAIRIAAKNQVSFLGRN